MTNDVISIVCKSLFNGNLSRSVVDLFFTITVKIYQWTREKFCSHMAGHNFESSVTMAFQKCMLKLSVNYPVLQVM